MVIILPDSLLLVRTFPEREDIKIYAVADVHLGAKECMEREFLAFIEYVKNTPNVYLILVGDLINNATKSSVSNCFDDVYRPAEQKKMMAKILEPVKDRILCAIPGNHEDRSGKDVDDDPMYDIMAKLDIEDRYRKNRAILKLQFGNNQKSHAGNNPTYVFAVLHGSGGGVLTGGSVNKAERYAYTFDGVDVLVMGHTHKPLNTTPGKIRVDTRNNTAKQVPFDIIVATSWLQYSDYAAKKMLAPTSHVFQKITLCGTKKEIEISTKHSY